MTTPITLQTVLATFRMYRVYFVGSVAVAVAIAATVWLLQPQRYDASVTIDIAREGIVPTQEYAYDQYYRLQADKQFAETTTHWLRTARVVDDILHQAKSATPASLRKKERFFSAQRISSQSVAVAFRVPTADVARRIATAMEAQLNRRADTLNKNMQPDWFVLTVSTPVIVSAQKSLWLLVGVGICAGIGVGIVAVVIAHALHIPQQRRKR